jgi:peptidylprolyl isomerase
MKKSEKAKGKEAAAARRKSYLRYAIILVIAVILVAAAGYFLFANRIVAQAGDTAGIYYRGLLDNGTEFDSNMNTTPLEFTLGSGQMIAGFDKAVIGMAIGEEKTVKLPADEAYGPYYPDLVVTVNRSANFSVANPVVGNFLTVTNPSTGETMRVRILNATPSTITVDANHYLAGQNLTFTIKLVTVRKA